MYEVGVKRCKTFVISGARKEKEEKGGRLTPKANINYRDLRMISPHPENILVKVLMNHWQGNNEGGAFAEYTLNIYGAAMFLNNRFHKK